jgi:hypothetical protein
VSCELMASTSHGHEDVSATPFPGSPRSDTKLTFHPLLHHQQCWRWQLAEAGAWAWASRPPHFPRESAPRVPPSLGAARSPSVLMSVFKKRCALAVWGPHASSCPPAPVRLVPSCRRRSCAPVAWIELLEHLSTRARSAAALAGLWPGPPANRTAFSGTRSTCRMRLTDVISIR